MSNEQLLEEAQDRGFASRTEVSSLRNFLEKTHESLNGYIAYIKRCGGK